MNGLLRAFALAVAAGLVLGKQVGIFLLYGQVRTGVAQNMRGGDMGTTLWQMSPLCGIGSPLSLFYRCIGSSRQRPSWSKNRRSVLVGSLISAVMAFVVAPAPLHPQHSMIEAGTAARSKPMATYRPE